jgi:nicotinate-nucleotide adenylyltransferase
MKRVGIFGGTFNPPHIGHCIVANEVLHALHLDEVRFMPNAMPPHKAMDHHVTDAQRLKMVQLAIGDTPKLAVETHELEKGGISYSYETMHYLTNKEPNTKFYFIIGGDSIDTLHSWKEIDQLTKLVTFVGVNRPGYKGHAQYPVEMVRTPEVALSSSTVRARVRNGETLQYLLPKAVEQFIREERLYE